jgi:beta-lactamase class D
MPNIFINHSSVDRVYPNGIYPSNWVKDFSESLEPLVHQYTGIRYKLWFDERDARDTLIDRPIQEALEKSEFLLALISPAYIVDEHHWCRAERDYFVNNVVRDETIAKGKIIATFKLFDEDELNDLPSIFDNHYTFKLYKVKNLQQRNIPIAITKADPDWNDYLTVLAYSIKQALKKVKKNIETRFRIFIADTNQLYDEQLKLNSEFISPEVAFHNLTPNINQIEKWKDDLNMFFRKCNISIHFFGTDYQERINGMSVEEFQWEQAIYYIKNNLVIASNFRIISWIPEDIQISSEAQIRFINKVKNEQRVPNTNIDYHDKSFEQFRTAIRELIDKEVNK